MLEIQDGQPIQLGGASSESFRLEGGKYAIAANATFGGGSIKLQVLLPDLATYLSVAAATDFTAAGFAVVDLPRGTYKFVVATATVCIVSVTSVPVAIADVGFRTGQRAPL
jgi:hypothetical protein